MKVLNTHFKNFIIMKNIINIIVFSGLILVMYSCTPVIYTTETSPAPSPQTITPQAPPQAYTPPQVSAPPEYGPQPTYQVFYDELGPYGSWVEYPSYGYVWIPRV